MADFQTRVDAITGLTSGTHYTTAELTEYLKDGVIEITNRIIALKPQQASSFSRESSEQNTNNSLDLNGAEIVSVVREDGVTSDNWRPCRRVSLNDLNP